MVHILLAEGFEEIEALTCADVMRRADIDARLVSMEGVRAVKGAHGIIVAADLLKEEVDLTSCDMLVLPGGQAGTANLLVDETVMRAVTGRVALGRWTCAICAAPMILGRAGVLEGKKATIYPGMEEELKGAIVIEDKNVVHDGCLITSKGPGTAMEFALVLVAALEGKEKAEEIRDDLLI